MMIYLYLKTHNVTGLKYLGKTIQDPFKYKGSGKYWVRHIKKHGYDVTTEVIAECETEEEFKKIGIHYSKLWNIIESKDFANLVAEEGGGVTGLKHSEETREKLSIAAAIRSRTTEGKLQFQKIRINGGIRPFTNETKLKISATLKGQKHTPERKAKIKAARAKQVMKPRSEETKRKISETLRRKAAEKRANK